jgi:hypothetical protein
MAVLGDARAGGCTTPKLIPPLRIRANLTAYITKASEPRLKVRDLRLQLGDLNLHAVGKSVEVINELIAGFRRFGFRDLPCPFIPCVVVFIARIPSFVSFCIKIGGSNFIAQPRPNCALLSRVRSLLLALLPLAFGLPALKIAPNEIILRNGVGNYLAGEVIHRDYQLHEFIT